MGMKSEKLREVLERIAYHGGILLKGLSRTIYGTVVSLAIGMSVYGFITTESEAGYIAVSDFVGSCTLLVIGLLNVYVMGGKKGWKK